MHAQNRVLLFVRGLSYLGRLHKVTDSLHSSLLPLILPTITLYMFSGYVGTLEAL